MDRGYYTTVKWLQRSLVESPIKPNSASPFLKP